MGDISVILIIILPLEIVIMIRTGPHLTLTLSAPIGWERRGKWHTDMSGLPSYLEQGQVKEAEGQRGSKRETAGGLT
jgi:hypothetical protein